MMVYDDVWCTIREETQSGSTRLQDVQDSREQALPVILQSVQERADQQQAVVAKQQAREAQLKGDRQKAQDAIKGLDKQIATAEDAAEGRLAAASIHLAMAVLTCCHMLCGVDEAEAAAAATAAAAAAAAAAKPLSALDRLKRLQAGKAKAEHKRSLSEAGL